LHVLSLINTPIPAQRAIKILLHNLKTYGAGNAPNTEEFIKLLKALIAKGIKTVSVTQCINF
jgi:hypothetical protein